MKKIALLLISGLLLLTTSCSKKLDWKNPLDPANDIAPNRPQYFSPQPDSQYVNTAIELRWASCADPNEKDSVVYDVFISSNNPPVKLTTLKQDETAYTITGLRPNMTYYWKIIARDNHGLEVSGPVWSFSTNAYYEVGYCNIPNNALGVVAKDQIAYVAAAGGMSIIDINTPANPTQLGYWESGFPVVWSVAVLNNYAFVGDEAGLRAVDVSNPASPSGISTLWLIGIVRDVCISGNYAFTANDGQDQGLRIIDISNPASMTEVGFYATQGSSSGLTVSGNYAYVADGPYGLKIIDVSNPTLPTEVGHYLFPGSAMGVAVSGNYAFVADSSFGLRILNVNNPATPFEIGSYRTTGYANNISLASNRAVVTSSNGFTILDVSNPTAPMFIGKYYTSGPAYDAVLIGSYLYVANGENGLRVVKIY